MKLRISIFALAIVSALPTRAEPSVVISLGSVGDRVRASNPDLAAARWRIREAAGRLRQSGRPSNPDLEVSFEHDPRFREGKLEIGFSQRFPVTSRLDLEKKVSAAEVEMAQAEVHDIERQITGKAREWVVKILAQRQRAALLNRQAATANEFSNVLTEMATKGEASPVDAGQARITASRLALQVRQLDVEETSMICELKPLLGMRPEEGVSISGMLPEPKVPSSGMDPSRRPDLQAARLDATVAERTVPLEVAKQRDDIEAGLFASVDRSEDAPEGIDNEAMIGVRFKFPLPMWNRNEGAIEEAQAKHERKEREADALKRKILNEAEAARLDMKQWAGLIREIDTKLMPQAEEQSKLSEATFKGGQGELQDVLRSREAGLEAGMSRIDALREFHLARVRYETATGNF